MRPCIECGTPSIPLESRKQVCSPRCQNRRRERQRGSGRKRPQCGKVNTYKKGCRCEDCKAAIARASRTYAKNYQARTGEPLTRKYRPPAPRKTCATCGGETLSRLDVPRCKSCHLAQRRMIAITRERRVALYERDSWTCRFCGEPVDPTLMGSGSPWEPTLDHIIPRSKGGGDDESNLRLLHRYCNSVRSNRDGLTLADFTT